jgi:P4 family phage/plasmid primase-like protien
MASEVEVQVDQMTHLDGALAWHDAGCSVIPILANGTKKPQGEWKHYQTERASRDKVAQWFKTSPKSGVGIICGKVSGNLELLELESKASDSDSLDKIEVECGKRGVLEAWRMLQSDGYMQASPSGGIHLVYRIGDGFPVPGNTKIANRPPNDEELAENPKLRSVTLAETRGEGGYFVAAPTSGAVHKSGESWSVLNGVIGDFLVLPYSVRNLIHDAIHAALDTMPVEMPRTAPERPAEPRSPGGLMPGEDWAQQTSWSSLLTSYGWSYVENRGAEELWSRPGKDPREGHSASLYYEGSDNLYCWSSSTDLPLEKPISKFAFYTFMEHRGDFSAAGRALRAQGYGSPMVRQHLDISDWELLEAVDEQAGRPAEAGDHMDVPAAKKMRIKQYTEKGVGRFAAEVYGKKVRYVHEERGWRVYRNGVWAVDTTRDIGKIAERVSDALDIQVQEFYDKAKDAFDSGQADGKEMLDEAKKLKTFAKSVASDRGMKAITSVLSNHTGTEFSQFDSDRFLLCLDNGTLDLRTMKLREHNSADMLTKRIPVTYDKDARGDKWSKILEDMVPDPAYRKYLKRAVGMSVCADTTEAAFFVLHGPTGCGKSTFIEIISAALGEYAATAAAKTFRTSRNGDDGPTNDLHDLMGTRFVSTSETSESTSLNEELIKRVTGGDKVTSRAMYQSNVTWRPQFTMWMATNFLPKMNSDDNAIWRRVKPIEFPTSFYADGRQPEKGLAAWIIENELSGVLNWILEGAAEFLEYGLQEPSQMTEAVRVYRDDTDQVRQFLTQTLDEGILVAEEGAEISGNDLYSVYFKWSQDNNLRPLGQNRFGNRLTSMGYESIRSASVRKRAGLKMNPAYGPVAATKPNKWW